MTMWTLRFAGIRSVSYIPQGMTEPGIGDSILQPHAYHPDMTDWECIAAYPNIRSAEFRIAGPTRPGANILGYFDGIDTIHSAPMDAIAAQQLFRNKQNSSSLVVPVPQEAIDRAVREQQARSNWVSAAGSAYPGDGVRYSFRGYMYGPRRIGAGSLPGTWQFVEEPQGAGAFGLLKTKWEWVEEAAPPISEYVEPEPECFCESRKLATIGHDEHCRYLAWKKRNK